MERKNLLVGGVLGGILLYMLPVAVSLLQPFAMVFKVVAMLVLAGGIISFIGYDVIMSKFGGKKKEEQSAADAYQAAFDREIQKIRKRVESGDLSVSEGLDKEKKLMDEKLSVVKKQKELEKSRKQIEGETQQKKGSGMNLGALLGGDDSNKQGEKKQQQGKKSDMLDRVGGLMGGSQPQQADNSKQQKQKQGDSGKQQRQDKNDDMLSGVGKILHGEQGEQTGKAKQEKKQGKKKDSLDELKDMF